MNITFLGGGDEIGASSAIIEIGAARILIDCGIRMSGDHRLPDLAAIQKAHGGQLDAILLTHAHMDHSGALPVVHQHFPGVPVYATAPTRGLVEVLLRDSINLMRARAESENELPLYSPPAVESLLEKMIPAPFGTPVEIGRTGALATWFPAGHILGAASVGVEAVEQGKSIRVLFSGDIAVADQLTVPGMLPPAGFRPDVLVIESTYGDRMHSPRELEEQRLIEMTAGVIEEKGKLLIPAFAVGRAQEIALMLLKQFRAKKLRSFPVWIDGMVKTVCGVYSQYPAHQTPYSRRLIEKYGNPFFNIVDEIRQVGSPAEREKVLTGDPCVIIASSGMLTGGASAFYAQQIVRDSRNGIAITGYQDEESPGRQLLALAAAETREVTVAGKTLEVECAVEKYALSAHADCNEIAGLIEAINPREVVLVHGEGSSRQALRELLRRQGTRYRPIHLPRTGDALTFGAIRKVLQDQASPQESPSGIGGGEELSAESLRRLATQLREKGEEGKLYSESDLLNLWYGRNGWAEDRYVELIRLLDGSEDFRRPRSRPHRVRLVAPEELTAKEALPEGGILYAVPQEVLARVDSEFGPETGLYHKGYDIASHTLRLMFEFPDVARRLYADRFETVTKGTGWSYTLNDKPHQGRLAELALELLPADAIYLRQPAIHLETKEVVLKLENSIDLSGIAEGLRGFEERTGFRIRFQTPEKKSAVAEAEAPAPRSYAPEDLEARPHSPGRQLGEKATEAMIEQFFDLAPVDWRPSRMKVKTDAEGDYVELAFLTPILGLRQRTTLQAAAEATGRRLRIRPNVNTFDLVAIAKEMIPPAWRLLKQPSLHQDLGLVRVKVGVAPDADAKSNLAAEYEERTGFRLDVTS